MLDVGVALTWIALSAASAKGLSVLARAALTSEADTELAVLAGESALALDALGRIDRRSPLPRVRP